MSQEGLAAQTAEDQTLDFIIKESDKRVTAQIQIMIAKDSRSSTLLSVSITLASAAFGVAVSQYSPNKTSPLAAGAVVVALISAFASFAAIWALWPKDMNVQGWSPQLFEIGRAHV